MQENKIKLMEVSFIHKHYLHSTAAKPTMLIFANLCALVFIKQLSERAYTNVRVIDRVICS